MSDFPNKIFTIILTFVMLVIAPITWSYVRGEMVTERLVLNEMSQFIDKVTDKGTITEEDLDDFYLAVNASGGTYDVKVKRYIRMATKDEYDNSRTLYLSGDYYTVNGSGDYEPIKMNIGDLVKVTVDDVGVSPAKRLIWSILRLDEGESKYSLVGSIR